MGRRTRSSKLTLAILVIACFLTLEGAGTSAEAVASLPQLAEDAEVLHFRWKTHGLLKFLFPGSGTATLVTERARNGRVRSQLHVATDGDVYWLAGSQVDAGSLTLIETWSSYRWRGRTKTKSKEISEHGVVDMIAAILTLREEQPQKKRRFQLLAGGVYPIEATPQSDPESGAIHYFLEGKQGRRGERWDDRAEISFDSGDNLPSHIALIGTLIRIDLDLDREKHPLPE